MPRVTVVPMSSGLPTAMAQSPIRTIVGVAKLGDGQFDALGVDFDDRDVRDGIRPDDLGVVALVADVDGQALGVRDHVIVGQDVAVRADDDARPGPARGDLAAAAPTSAEEAAEDRVITEGPGGLLRPSCRPCGPSPPPRPPWRRRRPRPSRRPPGATSGGVVLSEARTACLDWRVFPGSRARGSPKVFRPTAQAATPTANAAA